MAKVELTPTELKVHLSTSERIAALHGDLTFAGTQIRGAEVLDGKWWWQLGVRVPGTAIPGLIIAGTYLRKDDRVFASWRRGQQALAINLRGASYHRVIIGVDDAQALADQINDAIISC
jgi:hypothetical protein